MDDTINVASHTNPDIISQYSNSMHHNLQLNATLENNDRGNFLDLSINRDASQLEIDIFRKPTTTDTTISHLYIQPSEQNLQPTDTTWRGYSTSPSIMTDYAMSGKPKTTLQKKQIHNYPTPRTETPNKTHNNARYIPTNTGNIPKWANFTFISPHIRRLQICFKTIM